MRKESRDSKGLREAIIEIKHRNSTAEKSVSFFQLFRFASWFDILLIVFGIANAAISGLTQPISFLLFGDATGAIIDYALVLSNNETTPMALENAKVIMTNEIWYFTLYSSLLGFLTVLTSYVSIYVISLAAVRQTSKMRSAYMASILNKDISWYDMNQTGDFSSRIVADLGKIEEALGDKLSTFVFYISVFLSGVILGFVQGWKLTLICLIPFPLSIITMALVSWMSVKLVKEEMDAYASAGAIAEEVFSAIRTVVAFDGQRKELSRFQKYLMVAKENNIKRGFFDGINSGCLWFYVYISYALSLWFGVKFIIDERQLPEEERIYTPANMITIFFSVSMATWNFGQCTTFFQMFTAAKGAALKTFEVLDEQPTVNLSKNIGFRGTTLKGNIRFEGIDFHYPSRSDVAVLRNFNLEIRQGETVALVGNSGCGKSTCIQLIQRFYDPDAGRVFIDDRDIRDYDLKWYRNKIGVVGQEPVLFATTIEENIRYGNQNASFEEIKLAAEKANAHMFIEKLPNGYKTMVGERGAQFSGGQKQRIAIARAIIRNPSILLLDEATSALDTHSEALVQSALDSASKDCTTVIVAHRLSTIRGADRIIVINEGVVLEDGPHDELMKLQGAYYNLVAAQTKEAEDKSDDNLDDNLSEDAEESETQRRSSISVSEDEVFEDDEIKTMGTCSIIWRILKMNRPEWWAIAFASIGAAVSGAGMPLYSIVFGDVVGVLSNTDNEYVRSEGNKFSIYFTLIAVVTGISAFFQWYLFVISGEGLTLRIRSIMFKTMMKQEMGWFDKPENGVGAVCTKLSAGASAIQGAAGQPIGTALNALSSLGISIIIGFCYEWRITLVNICFVPFIYFSMYFETVIVNADTSGSKSAIENSSKLAVEAIGSIRTVASLGVEKLFHSKYLEQLRPHYVKSKKNGHMRGVVMGISRSILIFSYAAAIYYGGILIRDEGLDYSIIFKVSECLMSGAWGLGTAVAFAPNFQKGIEGSRKLFQLLARAPAVRDNEQSTISKIFDQTSNVKYQKVRFSYPTRPNVSVLKGLDLEIFQGKTVALVGPSGCGKSTIIQLLERFYDPSDGRVILNDNNLKNIKLSTLRMHLGIVSQEPNLFDRTILENIAYGDNSKTITNEEIIEAAMKANIHNFIASLPLGYETRLGEKGTQLSGGQKQRIAIARALIRDPQILLLDEATSALDTESEKVVQEALDKARKGRTCITIAHRLQTIQDADVICVIDKGVVVEIGTHFELLELKGTYHKLHSIQMGHK